MKTQMMAALVVLVATMTGTVWGQGKTPPDPTAIPTLKKVESTFIRTEPMTLDMKDAVLVSFQPPVGMPLPAGSRVNGVAQPIGTALSPGAIYDKVEFPAVTCDVTIPANTRIEKDSVVPDVLIPPPPVPRVNLGGLDYEVSTPPPAQAIRTELDSGLVRLQNLEQQMTQVQQAIAPGGAVDQRTVNKIRENNRATLADLGRQMSQRFPSTPLKAEETYNGAQVYWLNGQKVYYVGQVAYQVPCPAPTPAP